MDAINGCHITVPVTYDEPCPNCHGTGADSPSDVETCPYCGGTGYVSTRQQTIFGIMESQGPCPHCHGSGRIVRKRCHVCGGSGYSRVHKDLDVAIPAGISTGQQIRVKGKGERGSNGGENGDLYVEVEVAPDKRFRREGNDIHTDLSLNFAQCALGATVDVDTVYGPVSMNVPAGTQPEQVLKLRERGVKDLRTGRPGDQYVHVHVTTPTNLTDKEVELLSAFQKEEEAKSGKWWKGPFRH
jgi:molecular chaperone DnaJ